MADQNALKKLQLCNIKKLRGVMFEVGKAWEVSKIVVSGKLGEKNPLNLPFMFFSSSI